MLEVISFRYLSEETGISRLEFLEQMAVLDFYLSGKDRPFVHEAIESFNIGENDILFLCIDLEAKKIVGAAEMHAYWSRHGRKARVEGVVRHEAYKGRGIGDMLMAQVYGQAREWSTSVIDLTSNPTRATAHALYEKWGFKKRDTNSYRLLREDMKCVRKGSV